MRYHSLVIDHQSLPKELDVIAWVNDDSNKTIMGVKHKNYPLIGIQFHPESIFTEQGAKLIQNFIDFAMKELTNIINDPEDNINELTFYFEHLLSEDITIEEQEKYSKRKN